MPYIPDFVRRKALDALVELMKVLKIKADGDLNYVLFKYFKYEVTKGYASTKNYCAELTETAGQIREEFLYPYEKEKKEKNGDI